MDAMMTVVVMKMRRILVSRQLVVHTNRSEMKCMYEIFK